MSGFHYGSGPGFIVHYSGARLTRSMAQASLDRHRAMTRNPLASDKEKALAEHCVKQLTAAIAASFQPQEIAS